MQNVARSNGSSAWRRAESTIAGRIGIEQGHGSKQKYGAATGAIEQSNQGAEARNKYSALEHDALGPRKGSAIGKCGIIIANCFLK